MVRKTLISQELGTNLHAPGETEDQNKWAENVAFSNLTGCLGGKTVKNKVEVESKTSNACSLSLNNVMNKI